MSAELTPTEEPPQTDMISRQEFEDRLKLFERKLRERLDEERQQKTREQERAEIEAKWKRSEEWLNRLLSAVAGVAITIFFAICASQCSDLHSRISTLESKQSK